MYKIFFSATPLKIEKYNVRIWDVKGTNLTKSDVLNEGLQNSIVLKTVLHMMAYYTNKWIRK